ncbi:hypothetical protein TNCV_4502661 [Trichonephila clavipes]|nr:hypothetical protein TNCV_4502661 [Trichonephila clavipes]
MIEYWVTNIETLRSTGLVNMETDLSSKNKSSSQPSILDESVERTRQSFVRCPRKSTKVATCKLEMPQKTVRKIARKKITFQFVSFTIDPTKNRGRQASICAAFRIIDTTKHLE